VQIARLVIAVAVCCSLFNPDSILLSNRILVFLITAGLFAKFSAALVSIPASVLGGMTTFLFCAVAVSGMAIVNRVSFNRRTRFILTASLALGYGATLVPNWFSYVFTYAGNNHSLRGLLDAIELVMETGFAVTALVAMILNLSLPEEIGDTDVVEEEEIASTTTDTVVSKEQVIAQKVYEV
jgi:xanthine/uracil permease